MENNEEKTEILETTETTENTENTESLEYLELKELNKKFTELSEKQEKQNEIYLTLLQQLVANTDTTEKDAELITAITSTQDSDLVAKTSYVADLSLIGAIFIVIPLVYVYKFGQKMFSTFLGHL